MSSNLDVKRALYALHLGLIEIRSLARKHHISQIEDLADALEHLPTECLVDGSQTELARSLTVYRASYPDGSFDYTELFSPDPSVTEIIETTIRSS